MEFHVGADGIEYGHYPECVYFHCVPRATIEIAGIDGLAQSIEIITLNE